MRSAPLDVRCYVDNVIPVSAMPFFRIDGSILMFESDELPTDLEHPTCSLGTNTCAGNVAVIKTE
jgi:hypothetical protein